MALAVADRGPPLTPEARERLFEPFYTTKPDGLGLGLTICRKIMQAHGGDIRASNAPDGGAVMTLSLPRPPVA